MRCLEGIDDCKLQDRERCGYNILRTDEGRSGQIYVVLALIVREFAADLLRCDVVAEPDLTLASSGR